MKLYSADPQISPEDEFCELCAQANEPSKIPAGEEYQIIQTTEGLVMNICLLHFRSIATLQSE